MTGQDRERLQANLRLAESLGATVVRLAGSHVSDEILGYAREHNVTRIVIGKPTHFRLRDRLRGSLVSRIVRGSGDIDVHFIGGEAEPDRPRRPRRAAAPAVPLAGRRRRGAARGGGDGDRRARPRPPLAGRHGDGLPAGHHAGGLPPRARARRSSPPAWRSRPSISSSSTPFYTFAVTDTRHMLTFAMMFGVGLVISNLTSRLRRQERDARGRESRTAALYALARELATVTDEARRRGDRGAARGRGLRRRGVRADARDRTATVGRPGRSPGASDLTEQETRRRALGHRAREARRPRHRHPARITADLRAAARRRRRARRPRRDPGDAGGPRTRAPPLPRGLRRPDGARARARAPGRGGQGRGPARAHRGDAQRAAERRLARPAHARWPSSPAPARRCATTATVSRRRSSASCSRPSAPRPSAWSASSRTS